MPAELKPPMYSPTDKLSQIIQSFTLSGHHNSHDFHGESANGTELANEGLTVQTYAVQASPFTTVTVVQVRKDNSPLLFQA